MTTPPIPKPRTKFVGVCETNEETGQNEGNLTVLQQTPEIDEQKCEDEKDGAEGSLQRTNPPPPPPPLKPPRTAFHPNIEELRVNLEKTSGIVPSPTSPPNRMAPPPPPRPPPPGWRPDLEKTYTPISKPPPSVPPPPAPATPPIDCYMNRPLPSLPLDAHVPISDAPPISIKNPLYVSLGEFRAASGLAEPVRSPKEDDCEKLREWLSEDDEDDEEEAARPTEFPTIAATSSSSTDRVEVEDNPYTPCPRRSDYSAASHPDPFSSNQNIYVSHEQMFGQQSHEDTPRDEYATVEACSSKKEEEVVEEKHSNVYVNLAAEQDPIDEEFRDAKLQIDGSSVTFVGFVTMTSTRREKRLHCRLRNMQLSFHDDEESDECQHGPFAIRDILMFRNLRKDCEKIDAASTSSSQNSSILIHVGEKRQVVSFVPDDPATIWMFFLSEAWLSIHSGLTTILRDAENLAICGSVYVKNGSTGEWVHCSAGIHEMSLSCVMSESRDRVKKRAIADELVDIDLRKVVTLREKVDKLEFCPNVKHKRGPLMISFSGVSILIDSRGDSTTSNWFETIDEILKRPAKKLEHFRLTSDGIPVAVDKCIRFIASFGLKSEGIYRRNGKVSEAKIIMSKLMEDPVGFHFVEETDETVYAVADVLRQFFRKLDEPLILPFIHDNLFNLARQSKTPNTETLEEYGKVIGQLPSVHWTTLKKVVGHLKTVNENTAENRASIENLAKIFAASLFATDSMTQCNFSECYNDQINVMIHLINGYDQIFHITYAEEVSRQLVKEAEKKIVNKTKYGADLIVPIHMWEKENRPFNVKIGMAMEEVCREAVAKRTFDAPIDSKYALFEVLCDGQLVRRLPASEKISNSVLRWIEWNCKNGHLLFDHDKYHFDGNDMSTFTGKVKMAEPTSKTFKSYELKIENGVAICAFRNEKLWKKWSLDDVLWFVGGESSRKCPNQYNATMICTSKSSYCSRHPGYCISFKEEKERTRWLTAVNYAKTGGMPETPLVFL